jgi:hypothetical protein
MTPSEGDDLMQSDRTNTKEAMMQPPDTGNEALDRLLVEGTPPYKAWS